MLFGFSFRTIPFNFHKKVYCCSRYYTCPLTYIVFENLWNMISSKTTRLQGHSQFFISVFIALFIKLV